MKITRKNSKGILVNTSHRLIPPTLFFIALVASILCLTALLGCSSDAEPNQKATGSGNVTGSVKDENGNVYPNTGVQLSGAGSSLIDIRTDSNGNFSFDNMSVGSFDISIIPPLSTSLVSNNATKIIVQADQTVTVDFVIKPKQVKANLNFGSVQLLEEIKDKDGNTPTNPSEPLYASNIFDAPIGLLTAIKAPDGHHVTLSEYKMAKGNLRVHCNGDSSSLEVSLEGMIPNGTYTFWLAYLNKKRSVGEPVDFMNDFVNFNNPPVGPSSGTENSAIATAEGTIDITLEHTSCILTDEVALVIPILYHINGKTFGGGHVPDAEEVVQMLVYFQ